MNIRFYSVLLSEGEYLSHNNHHSYPQFLHLNVLKRLVPNKPKMVVLTAFEAVDIFSMFVDWHVGHLGIGLAVTCVDFVVVWGVAPAKGCNLLYSNFSRCSLCRK